MKVLVTGASGFIGQNLVARLVAGGHQVRAVYRRSQVPPALAALALERPGALELLRQDLAFPASMPRLDSPEQIAWRLAARAGVPPQAPAWSAHPDDLDLAAALCAGMDAVCHIAALVGDWGSHAAFFGANVNPTRILLEAARKAGIKRFEYVSSISVHGFGHNRQATEDGSYFKVHSAYQISKRQAEALVNQAIAEGFDARIARPGNVYGPGDTTTFYPIFEAMAKGLNGTVGGGGSLTCPVYIDDLVEGMVALLERDGLTSRCFNLTSGETISWRQLFDLASDALGMPRGKINLPAWLAWILAWGGEAIFGLLRLKFRPPFTRYTVQQLLHDYQFSIRNAAGQLGYAPQVMAAEGMRRTAAAWKASRLA